MKKMLKAIFDIAMFMLTGTGSVAEEAERLGICDFGMVGDGDDWSRKTLEEKT